MWRDWYFWFLQLFPPVKHQLHLGNRREGMTQYEHERDMPFLPELGGGKCFPQVYCVDLNDPSAKVYFTDDVIWHNDKKCLFQLLVLPKTLETMSSLIKSIEALLSRPGSPLTLEDTTVMLDDVSFMACKGASNLLPQRQLYRVASGEEFAGSRLCNGRPKPKGYDPHRLGKEVNHCPLVILRPDRFVFAACKNIENLENALESLREFLHS